MPVTETMRLCAQSVQIELSERGPRPPNALPPLGDGVRCTGSRYESSRGAHIALSVVASLGIALTLVAMAFVYRHRDAKVIKASCDHAKSSRIQKAGQSLGSMVP